MTKTNKDDDKATQSSGLINNQPDPDKTSKQEDHQFSNADMADRTLATVTREDERSADDVGHHPDQPPEEIDTWIHSHEANSRITTHMPVLIMAMFNAMQEQMYRQDKDDFRWHEQVIQTVLERHGNHFVCGHNVLVAIKLLFHCLEVFVKQECSISNCK